MNAIAVGGSTVYVGGTFTTLEADCNGGLNVTRNRLAAFDAVSCPLDWNPDVDNAVQSLAVSGGSVYAGGKFTTVGGSPRNHLAGISIAERPADRLSTRTSTARWTRWPLRARRSSPAARSRRSTAPRHA